MIDRLPTLCTLTPGQRISYSEVVAFHNVIRGKVFRTAPFIVLMHFFRNGHGRKVCQPRSPESTFYHLRNRIIREATAKSNDGRIDQSDFLNHAASSSRYSLFTPMEASIIFHFAGRGVTSQKLALLEFAQLLDPRWRAPHDEFDDSKTTAKTSFLQSFLHSSYNFVQGGE